MSGGGGGGERTVPERTTSVTEPPAFLKDYLTSAAQRAQILGQRPEQFFPGRTYVPASRESNQAANLLTSRVGRTSRFTPLASNVLSSTLGAPPNVDSAFQAQSPAQLSQQVAALTRGVAPAIQSQAAAAGGSGSAAAPALIQREISDAAARLIGQERGRELQAGLQAQQLEQDAIGRQLQLATRPDIFQALEFGDVNRDIQNLTRAGQFREAEAAKRLQDQIDRFTFQQEQPHRALSREIQQLIGVFPGQTTTTTGQRVVGNQPNPFLTGLGGGLSGAAVGSAFGPVGAVAGGLGGLLLGGLGGLF